MPAHHALTILAVRDLALATRFYREAFAWKQIVEAPVYIEFALPGGMRFGLYRRESFAKNTGQMPAPTPTDVITPTELYFYVDEPDAAMTRALSAGARLLSGLSLRDWGDEAAYLADLDGNVIVLARATKNAAAPELREVAKRWLHAWQGRGTSCIDDLHAADFVDHSAGGRSPDNAGFKQGIADLYAAFPDFYGDADDINVDEDAGKVTIVWSAKGTHRATFLGVAATHKAIAFRGIEVLKVRDGKIVERWGEWDGIDLACQLGALSLSAAAADERV
ncbi:MAG: ester cyclase [Deltaproteobacteria bacterium]|nr:ester cyclase [Deltaproteobacteria bacterium]